MLYKVKLLTILTVLLLSACVKNKNHKNKTTSETIPIVTIAPNYPKTAAENRIEGDVTIEFTITTMGSVKDPKVISTIPSSGIFNREALRAILKYKFVPRIVNGKTVEARAVQTINFRLSREKE